MYHLMLDKLKYFIKKNTVTETVFLNSISSDSGGKKNQALCWITTKHLKDSFKLSHKKVTI